MTPARILDLARAPGWADGPSPLDLAAEREALRARCARLVESIPAPPSRPLAMHRRPVTIACACGWSGRRDAGVPGPDIGPRDDVRSDDVAAAKGLVIPDEVMAAFNTMIAARWDGRRSAFRQDEVVDAALSNFDAAGRPTTRDDLFDRHWLDVEPVYRAAGWLVEYDRPGFNETYPATFAFSRAAK